MLALYTVKSEAEVDRAARNQTHGVVASAYGEMTHCGPLVLFRVVQEHLVSAGASDAMRISVATYIVS